MNKTQWPRHWRVYSLVGALMVLALFIMACGGDDATETPTQPPATATMAPSTPAPTMAPAATMAPSTPAPTAAATRAPTRAAAATPARRTGYRRTGANGGANDHSHNAGYRQAHACRYAYGSRSQSAGFAQAYSGQSAPVAPGHYDVADFPR